MVSVPWGRTQSLVSLISALISVSIQMVILSPMTTLWVTTSLSEGRRDWAAMICGASETKANAAIRAIASDRVMARNVRELVNFRCVFGRGGTGQGAERG